MKFELDNFHRNTSDEELINDLINVSQKLGTNAVTIEEYNLHGNFHPTTLIRRFNTWFKVLEKAGLQKTRNLNITEEELFENLENVWIKLQRQPKYSEMVKPLSKYSSGTYEYRFGSWRKGLEKFVTFINQETNYDRRESTTIKEKIKKPKTQRQPNHRLRFLVMRKDNFKCVMCGKSPANYAGLELEIDHIKPWSKGGETILENLQTLCSVCNGGKSNLEV